MHQTNPINTYDSATFTSRFMPADDMRALSRSFFILPVEDMYRHLSTPLPPLRATSHSLLYITHGLANMCIGGIDYSIGPNQMLIVAAGQIFSFKPGDVNKGYICHFNGNVLTGKFGSAGLLNYFEFLSPWANPLLLPDAETAGFIEQLMQRLALTYKQSKLKEIDLIQPYLLSLLCEINRAYQPAPANGTAASLDITNRFKALVFKYFREIKTVKEYAERLNISSNHLNKAVKAATQKPASAFIDDTIMAEARVLLTQTSNSASQIAYILGFNDPSYFARIFKKYQGLSPLSYRMIEKCL